MKFPNPFQIFRRASPENPSTNLSDPDTWLFAALGATTATSGITVTPDNSLELSAVWAATRLISSTIAALPLPVYQVVGRGKEKARSHPLYRLLHDRPNPEMSSFHFRELLQAHLLLYGTAYAEIERNGAGVPIALWPLHPSLVRIERFEGRKFYVVRTNGQDVPVKAESILHIPGFGLDGTNGLIPMSVARNSIGAAKATEQFGSSFFANGASPSGVLQHPGKLNTESAARLKASWTAAQSGLSNAQRTAILEDGMTWNPLGVAPEHAQFLETRTFGIQEVARWFGLPPHMLADLTKSSFSNIEQQSISFVQTCILPWAKRWEAVLNYDLFTDPTFYCEFQLAGLLRGDSAARAAFYTSLFNIGALSPNDVRDLEGMNPVDGGDEYYRPLNMERLNAPTTKVEPANE